MEGILDKEGIEYRQAIAKIEEETGDVAESTMGIKDGSYRQILLIRGA